MGSNNVSYGWNPSEPRWVSKDNPYWRCVGCNENTHEDELDEDCYCLDCSPICDNCGSRGLSPEEWKSQTLCSCCFDSIYECEVCEVKTLKDYCNADGYFTCKLCYEKNPRE